MYFKYIFLFSLSIFVGCHLPYEPFVEDFTEDISQSAMAKCENAQEPDGKGGCDIKKCLSSPITLLAMQDLMEKVDMAFSKVGVPYVLDGGSQIAQLRFQAHLPWDDDGDIDVLEEYFTDSKREAIRKILAGYGLELEPFHTIMGLIGRKGLYQVSYTKEPFIKIIENYAKTHKKHISDYDKENLWERYDVAGRLFPHLDIFVWKNVGNDKYLYQAEYFNKSFKNRGIDKTMLYPPIPVNVLGKNFWGMNDFLAFSEIYFGTREIVKDFVINPEHKLHCKKFRLKDITTHPEYLRLFHNYLKYVFKDYSYSDANLHPDLRSAL